MRRAGETVGSAASPQVLHTLEHSELPIRVAARADWTKTGLRLDYGNRKQVYVFEIIGATYGNRTRVSAVKGQQRLWLRII